MTNKDRYGSFTKEQLESYYKEVKERWGDKALKETIDRTSQWTKEDFKKAEEEGKNITLKIAELMDKGVTNDDVQIQIDRYFRHVNKFYACSYEIFRGLGKMYVTDKRFEEYYKKYHPKLPQFICKAMDYYCDEHENQYM